MDKNCVFMCEREPRSGYSMQKNEQIFIFLDV